MVAFNRSRLKSRDFGAFVLLDAVETVKDNERLLSLFFDREVLPEKICPRRGAELYTYSTLGGQTVMRFHLPDAVSPVFTIDGQECTIEAATPNFAAFEGRNALAAVRNGEDAEIVLDWLAYHADQHLMDAALILDRAKPGEDEVFARELQAGLRERDLTCNVELLSSDMPLGRADLPPEWHPFCAPDAPGKDRMDVPPPDRRHSPLGAASVYEMMRSRGLSHARAVANIDVCDLITRGEDSIFDLAVNSSSGLISLVGRRCYPWRLRDQANPHFSDHICVQFDNPGASNRWCIARNQVSDRAVWRRFWIGNVNPSGSVTGAFYRFTALRHSAPSVSKIVPKTSLVEDAYLINQAETLWDGNPKRAPRIALTPTANQTGGRVIVTAMKNEGPFVLEWLAYHRAIGFDDVIVYTNDCTDGTDTMLKLLERRGYVQHRVNPFREMGLKPQHAALRSAQDEPVVANAAWVTCIDVDEFVNIKCGDGTLDALFEHVPDANMIAMTWRLFGNCNVHLFDESPVIEKFIRCAREFTPKPHQAWGFKTLFRNVGLFKKLGVHRPKGLNPQLWESVHWVNGSGQPLPRQMYRNSWRSTTETYGYDLVQLNHYAVRSAESFLVKRDRGRVNHVDRDQGLAYWFRMNNNAEIDRSIARMLPKMRVELNKLLKDSEIAEAHAFSLKCHRTKIEELKARPDYNQFYSALTSHRMERLSLLHSHFGANVFLSGPEAVPDEVIAKRPDAEWFFTVERQDVTQH